jgi:CheY-like chemotaxis protein
MKMRAEQSVDAREPRSGKVASPPRFLVVDDESEGRALVSGIILSRYPPAVIRAASSNAEAFRILLGFAPDIVVTELSRKGGAGYEFLRKLRQCPQLARTPVVLSSRRGRDADAFGISVEGLHEAACKRVSQEAMMIALFTSLLGRGAISQE